MNTLCENLNEEPASGTNETVSELFSLKLLYENTKHRTSYRFIFIPPAARRRQKEERKRQGAIARYATAFNKWKRTRRARRTWTRLAFIFISDEVVSCPSFFLALRQAHEETRVRIATAFTYGSYYRHLFTVVGGPCLSWGIGGVALD